MHRTSLLLQFIFLALILALGCRNRDLDAALDTITAEDLAEDVRLLSSDEFEGRSPSSKGEEKTIQFLKQEFEKLGVKPGNGDSYFQEVPLVALTTEANTPMHIKGEGQPLELNFGTEVMAWTKRVVGKVALRNSDLVFVGYGALAPEYDWNDYEGMDFNGKTVVMLVNDPGFTTQDSSLFNGNAMTYYGRWTYKFEEAARQGADGAVIIHETKPAGYPWEVVRNSWSGKQFDLVSEDNNMSRCAIESWWTRDAADRVFEQAGLDLDSLKTLAVSRDFTPVELGLTASMELTNDIEHSRSNNVIAVYPGRERPEEYIFYMAHWDHFGKDTTLEGDQIYNGAFDNATGTAGLLEIAEAFTSLLTTPQRSVAFLAVTAEEQGLLGSKYYAENPIYPRNKTVAAINMDGLNVYGEMRDITVIGYGNSELDQYVEDAARRQGRRVRPDPEPEKGYFYRSDHFSFAKQGIPALYTDQGIDHVEHGEEWTLQQLDEYTRERYHKPGDEFNPDWDLSGAVHDLRLLFRVGYRLSDETHFPEWNEGTEFRARRQADRQNASSR